MAQIDKDFNELHQAYRLAPELKSTIDRMKEKAISFQDTWAPLVSRLAMLKEFCGGTATVLPNIATVESEFSCLSLDNNECHKALTDFSLEGVLQSKQFAEFTALEWSPIMSLPFLLKHFDLRASLH